MRNQHPDKDGRNVAIKSIQYGDPRHNFDPSPEIGNIAESDHPHVNKLHYYIIDRSTCHLVMDLCQGGTLREVVVVGGTCQARIAAVVHPWAPRWRCPEPGNKP